MSRLALAAASLALAVGCSKTPQRIIEAATNNIGAATVKNIEYSGSGFAYVLGQAPNPTAPWPKFNAKSYKRAISYDVPAFTQTLVRTQFENPPHGGGNQPIFGENTQTISADANSPWNAKFEIWMTPHGFLKGAAANNATLGSATVGGKTYDTLTFTTDGHKMVGYLTADGLVEKVESTADNPVLGDMPVEATYADYKDFGGLKFPSKITAAQGGFPTLDITVTEAKANTNPKIDVAPAPAVTVKSEMAAPGVYYITGGTHHSVAIEFADHVAVVEGPQTEARSAAVIAETKRLFPAKPIRYLINTHHHFDHSGGLRPFLDEGATVVTHEINKAYYEKMFATAKTNKYETMTDKKVLTDGKRSVELHHIAGSGHNDGFILAYLPAEKILIEADAFTPAATPTTPGPKPPSPFATNLADNLDRLKLNYTTILPIHGRKSSKAEFLKFIYR